MLRKKGCINADIFPGPNIDVVFDATKPWPFKDGAVGFISSSHVLEHLPSPYVFFREAYRVLAYSPLANMEVRLPYGASDAGMGDITHIRSYLPVSFACFQPGYNDAINNPQHDAYDAPFSVMAIHLVPDRAFHWCFLPVIRNLLVPYLRFLWGAFTEMVVVMRALKTPEEIDRWKQTYKANEVPIGYRKIV